MNQRKQHGFTMIEILIALLVFGLGVLGVTVLTTQSQRITHHAYQSMAATMQLHDLMELIMANASEARGSNSYLHAHGDSIPSDPNCITSNCSATQLATYDLNQWLTETASVLPQGAGEITKNGTTYTLTLRWDGNRVGSGAGTDCPNNSDDDLMCQQLVFEL